MVTLPSVWRNVMSETTEADIQALIAEMKTLRADFARIGEILKDTARHGAQDASETVRETAEQGWHDAKSTAQNLFEEMEQRPLQSALTIFGVGVLLGILFGRR
jgi:ElaB/YqjD/DUF883 family membrane-anchored ribosome-binding protein